MTSNNTLGKPNKMVIRKSSGAFFYKLCNRFSGEEKCYLVAAQYVSFFG